MTDDEIREARRISRIRRRQAVKEYIREYKRKASCTRCKEDHPACLEFHHEDPELKDLSVSDLIKYSSLKKVKNEIDKCMVLCANCHRKEHYATGDWNDDRGPLV